MNRFLILSALGLLVSCSNYGQLTFITKLPKKLDENSGLITLQENKVWVIEDSGNKDEIYEVDFEGRLLKELKVKNAKNKDWEDLTYDPEGNVYIGDIGNNDNRRKDLAVYKIPNPVKEHGDKIEAKIIRFKYPEQKEFPPKAVNFRYNAEALFYHNDLLYIITKNKAKPFKGDALVYTVPAVPGNYEAQLIGKLNLCKEASTCVVTAAAISPNTKKVVLLGYGKLWVFTDFKTKHFTKGKMRTVELGATTQLESVCFLNDSTLLLSDEQSHGTGRNLYSYTLTD